MTYEPFDAIAHVLPEPTLLVTSDGVLVSANPAAFQLLEVTPAEIRDRLLAEWVQDEPADMRRYLAACARSRQMVLGTITWQRCADSATVYRCEGAVLRPWSPNAPALIVLRLKPRESASNRFVLLNKKIDELAKEVHVRRQAEARLNFLAEASAVLARSLDYEVTLQSVADLIVPDLADWCVVSVVQDGEVVMPVAMAHRDPEKRTHVRRLIQHYAPGGEAPHNLAQVVRRGRPAFYPDISATQLEAWVRDAGLQALIQQVGFRSVMVVPMQAPGGRVGAIAFVRGAHGRRYREADLQLAEELARRAAMEVDNAQLYREAEQARWHAEEMNRLKSAFLANMSHEIRTPLTGIIGLASLLAQDVPEGKREYARRIESGGRRLLDTLNAVLALAQLEAKQMELELEPLSIAAEVQQAIDLMRRQAEKKGIELHYKVGPAARAVRARLDRGAFSSIIHNLVGNAIKYTDHGSIMVTVRQAKDKMAIDVEDTGIGIDGAFLPHVFDPFRQETGGWGRSHEGAGLGLSITQRMVEHMNGRIEARSDKGRGSCFTVYFPKAAAVDDAASSPSPDRAPEPQEEPAERHVCILVVEDNPDTLFFMRTLLERIGDVHTAITADEALKEAQNRLSETAQSGAERPFDLILIDINLGPGKSGVDVLEALRTQPAFRDVPMAAVTAYAMPGDRERLLAEGFDAYLAKPFGPEELLELTNRLLKRRG